ncbi:hypothetical protein RFI_00347 [Reticulomyxa filosa]|uniref:Uncharacterized protein n=1 Tax=Reticulomyxa filosa TaxID=46433 RepID=X6PES8_RETFI|nr:hypothetical protein RFI_00347 [Reticulomyxa filosa]|eukprot:ETO36716.1 hypothetical protein RFI_00347 [Reticulomyxa filosa]
MPKLCADFEASPRLLGTYIFLSIVLVVAGIFCCTYSFYHLWKPENVHPVLRITCLFYHVTMLIMLCAECFYLIGTGQNWWLHAVPVCQTLFFIISSLFVLAYGTGVFFWLKRLGLNCWLAFDAGCLQYFSTKDFALTYPSTGEVNGKKVYWTCRRASLPFNLTSAVGIGTVSILNITIGYMYITRMIQTARMVHRNEEIDLAHVGANQSNHEISKETMRILDHVKKCGIIALTSISFSLISFTIAWSSLADFFIYIDSFFNGVLMLSSFTFAENIFHFCFGCCNKPSELLLSKIIKDT